MLKCKICGCEFPAVFDCPMCGCQIVAQERKRNYTPVNHSTKED